MKIRNTDRDTVGRDGTQIHVKLLVWRLGQEVAKTTSDISRLQRLMGSS
jgi:hypothetical protein